MRGPTPSASFTVKCVPPSHYPPGLAAVTRFMLLVMDYSFLLSLGGATLGNALIYAYPALMFCAVVKKKDGENKGLTREVAFAMAMAAMSVVVSAIGGTTAIKSLLN